MNVVYCSYDGRYSDNPRALYEGVPRSAGDRHQWLCHPMHRCGFPRAVDTITAGSVQARQALEDADLVIANSHLDLQWDKKPGATYLQTWHGTPLKRIHSDVFWAPPGRLAQLDADVARWDYLVSPNPVSTPRLRSAFAGFQGEVLETGYPRNDVLVSARSRLVRARVRATLGLSDDTTAVLYAPTWRDDEHFAEGAPPVRLALDIDAFVDQLGDRHTLLPRLHYLMTDRMDPLQRSGVVDVSRYPDVQELFLAADVLVTDYSSSMFDFAVTGKPMIFFTYDLESYRDSLRGFYFDLPSVAPGPLVRTTDALIEALDRLPEVRDGYAERYRAFWRTFCPLDDGRATQRLGRRLGRLSSERELAGSHD